MATHTHTLSLSHSLPHFLSLSLSLSLTLSLMLSLMHPHQHLLPLVSLCLKVFELLGSCPSHLLATVLPKNVSLVTPVLARSVPSRGPFGFAARDFQWRVFCVRRKGHIVERSHQI